MLGGYKFGGGLLFVCPDPVHAQARDHFEQAFASALRLTNGII